MLSQQVIFTAKLLAGEMPQDIEQAFTDAGLSLFPAQSKDLDTECSCPDWSNPCKHIAAVYYLLGEEFDRNPFLIFKLRGMEREESFEHHPYRRCNMRWWSGLSPKREYGTGRPPDDVIRR